MYRRRRHRLALSPRGSYRSVSGDELQDSLAHTRPGATGVEPGDITRQALKRLAARCAVLRDVAHVILSVAGMELAGSGTSTFSYASGVDLNLG